MSKILEIPDIYHYSIAEHAGFHKQCSDLCTRHDAIIDAQELVKHYTEKVNQEDYIYKWMRRKEHTEKKAETDHQRDNTYVGLTAIVRANLRHFDPAMLNAANRIHKLLGNYGNVAQAHYDAETVAIDSIVAHLQSSSYIEDVRLLGLMPWIDRLNDLNAQFKQYVQETIQEEINKPEISAKESRRQTDEALRKITVRIEALANLGAPDRYMPFAREYNEIVEHYNQLVHEHYGRIHARTDISTAYVAPIPAQPFTGKPVCVIPEVKLTKKAGGGMDEAAAELVFTQDFTVSYKNNISPGTATLAIQGIGKYKGEIVTTFNINP
ncbi:MAG: DUF6261 family protein [Bacteroidales bacterium]|jgi:hypothetical protein|nr:DUF6261 family protein [Bacteroidales bacterium]